MFDGINMRESLSPIPSAAKVERVERRHSNMQQRRFSKQFKEEEENEKKGEKEPQSFESSWVEDEKEKRKRGVGKDHRNAQKSDKKDGKNLNDQGGLVDILA